ncbi:MAG: hypothetical protein HYY84_07380 [Deltaproteobacteria bacterium]|nr:hypothetical protein [Deltaproteobacteria bacterium]
MRCWGLAASGQLGYGNTQSIGDDAGETPSTAGDVSVGGDAIQVATGGNHTCAILSTGRVRCWGLGASGQLGYGAATNIGDDAGSVPSDAGDVSIYADSGVTEIGAGANHTCALIATGNVRCWGLGASGQLGYGNTENIGDDAGELPSTVGDVNVGATVSQIAVGANHTCAVTSTGTVRCWGEGAFGKLGYASTTSVGDLVVPASAGDVGVGGLVVQVAAGANHTCALTATGNVRCWGSAAYGQLGYGNTIAIGDTETPSTAGDVSVFPDGGIVQLAAGANHTCALHATGNLRCWGRNNVGQLGYAHTNDIGDDAGEYPSTAGDVGLDGGAIRITAGASHTCAILASGQLRCWGQGASGRLGYGATTDIGDDEFPFAAGDVSVQ